MDDIFRDQSSASIASLVALIKEAEKAVPPRVNIFIFGAPGWGKSSFINTILHCFGQTDNLAHVYQFGNPNGQSSVTSVYQNYQIPGTNIYLFDTYGWERSAIYESTGEKGNYNVNIFSNYLRGSVAIGQDKDKPVDDAGLQIQNKIDICLFFVQSSLAKTEMESLWEKMKAFHLVADTKYHIPALYVLSQLDTVSSLEHAREMTPKSLVINKEWLKVRGTLINTIVASGVKQPIVLPLISYLAEEISANMFANPNVALFSLEILYTAIQQIKRWSFKQVCWNIETLTQNEKFCTSEFCYPSSVPPPPTPYPYNDYQ